MNARMTKIVHAVRTLIYLALFGAFAVWGIMRFAQAEEPRMFWPPDMVPHPHLPQPPPPGEDWV